VDVVYILYTSFGVGGPIQALAPGPARLGRSSPHRAEPSWFGGTFSFIASLSSLHYTSFGAVHGELLKGAYHVFTLLLRR
jgi:hypothetical protein